jgi:predicted dehydrogenase
VTVCSRNPETRDLVPSGCTIVEDWHALIRTPELDGVVIATPPEVHVEMAEAAVAVDLPALVEKPLCLDLGEAERLQRLVTDRRALVAVEHTHLYSPAFRALKAASAALGPGRAIASVAGNPVPAALATPALWNWGSHDVAMYLDLMGSPPERVDAEIVSRREIAGRVAERVRLRLWFPGDVLAEAVVGDGGERRERRLAVHFDGAVLVYDDLAPTKLTRHAATRGFSDPIGPGEPIAAAADLPLTCAVREFAAAALARRSDTSSVDLGVAVVRVLSRCQRTLDAP